MTALVLGLAALTLCATLINLIAAGGWPAWVGLLAATATFGADPADPWRAVATGALVFSALAYLRRA